MSVPAVPPYGQRPANEPCPTPLSVPIDAMPGLIREAAAEVLGPVLTPKELAESIDETRRELAAHLPPCPACGCRTVDDAESSECGCDAGCNAGSWHPGVNVLIRALERAKDRIDQLADASDVDESNEVARSATAEIDAILACLGITSLPTLDGPR